MATHVVVSCWSLAFALGTLLRPVPLSAQAPSQPGSQARQSVLPGNPFPRANCILLEPTDSGLVAMTNFVRYLHTQGYVVDSVDQAIFFTVWAHATLPRPRRPLHLQVRANFGGPPGTVRLRGTYAPLLPLRVRVLPVSPAHAFTPPRPRSVRYSTWLAPDRRAAFVELQRLGREAFPGALLTYANEAF